MPSAGVDNTQRRKWDKDVYTKKAAERERAEDEKYGEKDKSTSRPSVGTAIVERKELNVSSIIQRDYKKELESRVGTKTIVNLDTGEGLGFKCKESGVILKDSMAYLDHINGKKQQKALGMSMRVERSTVDQVMARFESVKRKKAREEDAKRVDFAGRVAAAAEDEERLRRERQERKKQKKEEKKSIGKNDVLNELGDSGGMDPEMAAMMGFGGFGGGKKKD
jgi:U4/U6.U5 tri-snRNP component SNU23